MVKFRHTAGETQLYGFGITRENVRRLQKGQPIHIDMEQMGLPNVRLAIFYGKTENDLLATIQPYVGKKTKVNQEPICAICRTPTAYLETLGLTTESGDLKFCSPACMEQYFDDLDSPYR